MSVRKNPKGGGSPANNRQLRRLMEEHGLNTRDVARLTRSCINASQRATGVEKWLFSPEAAGFRTMSDADLRLLQLELALIDEGHPLALKIEFEGPTDVHAVLAKARQAKAKKARAKKRAAA